MTNVLFVCRYNRFRSKVAEAFFNKINKNPKNAAKSAGVIRGKPISKEIINAAKEFGLDLSKENPQGLAVEMLQWNDLTVVVADDVPKEVFNENPVYGKGLEVWSIQDASSNNKPEMRRIIKLIEKKVGELVERIS